MKRLYITTLLTTLTSFLGFSQTVDDYEILIIQGSTPTHLDVIEQLDVMGHTSTPIPYADIVDGYDFSPYDVAIFMWDTPMTFSGYSDLIAENEACNIGIVSMTHYVGMDSLFIGHGDGWTSGDFSISDNSHWITEPWAEGALPLEFTYKTKLTNIPEGATTLGLAGTDTTLVVHDTYRRASAVFYGHTAGMPWNADAENLIDRIICWTAFNSCCDVNTTVTATDFTLTADNTDATYQWIDCADYSVISGATNQSFTPTENGEYAVILTEGECIDTSDCFTISALSLNELGEYLEVSIFPNPTNGNFKIQTNAVEMANVFIYNASGKLVFESKFQGELLVDTALENGTYIIRYVSDKATNISKLIIQ